MFNSIKNDILDNEIFLQQLTFGFGSNAGLEASCLAFKNTTSTPATGDNKFPNSQFVTSVRWVGWLVLAADIVFVAVCVKFLYRIFTVSIIKSMKN